MGVIGSLLNNYSKGTARQFDHIFKLGNNKMPYMKYKEVEFFTEILHSLKPKRILEYGCGFSTAYFTQILPKDIEWVSIEHNQEWFDAVKESLAGNTKVELHFVKPEVSSWTSGGTYSDFKSYVDYPEKLGKFDLILVDGVAREACIQKSHSLLNDGGIVVVHDCNRTKYHNDIMEFPNWLIIEDFRRNAGGFGIGSKTCKVETLADIPRHQQIWKVDNAINNFFKFKYLLGKPSKGFRLRGSNL